VTGIDDHSRFIVISGVVMVPSGRAVCEAFAAAMRRFGVPGEVLTDIQDGCWRNAWHCPAGGVRLFVDRRPPVFVADRSEHAAGLPPAQVTR
jgi:hypothetical protein